MSRLRWTPEEQDRLYEAALPKLLADADLILWKAVDQAQTTLPQGRRRRLVTVGMIPPALRNRLQDARDAATGRGTRVQADALRQALDRVAGLEQANKELSSAVTALRSAVLRYEALPKPPEPLDVVKDFLADVLRRAQKGATERPAADPQPKANGQRHDPEPAPSGTRRRKVFVVGGQQQDHAELHKAFGGRFDMRYFQRDLEGPRIAQIADAAAGADDVLFWTDRATHKLQDALNKRKVAYRYLSGTLSDVKAQLNSLESA